MFRSIVCGILLVTVAAAGVVPKIQNDIATKVILVDDVSQLKDLYKGAELIPINRIQERDIIRYTLGERVSYDRLVSHSSDSYQWDSPQNVQLFVQYPAVGVGAVISFVEIIVNQSSNLGQAYVISGGIGQTSIVFVVEVYNTYWFDYIVNIYGV